MTTQQEARALIVVESYWGNTAALAEAMADGLRSASIDTTVVAAADAPRVVGTEITHLLIGAPTHNMSLPSPASRRMAATRGVEADRIGVREWIEELHLDGAPAIYAFDTHTSKYSGSASRAVTKLLRRRRIGVQGSGQFLVAGDPPALVSGELQRAVSWAAGLAASR